MKLSEIKITPLIDTLHMEDISDAEYFSKKYSNYVSNSRLGKINPEQGGSPEKFFNGDLSGYSDSFIFGSALHELVLQPEDFVLVEEVDRPTAKAGYMADELYKPTGYEPTDEEIIAASDKIGYYKGKMSSLKILNLRNTCRDYWRDRAIYEHNHKLTQVPIYLSPKYREKLATCLDKMKHDKDIQSLLHPTAMLAEPITGNEQTILLDVKVEVPGEEPFILHLKSKLDNFTIDRDANCVIVNDVKTAGCHIDEFVNAIDKWHYYREMAMYCWLLQLCAKKFYGMKSPTIKSNFLVVETLPKYNTGVVPMTGAMFNKGMKEFTKLLKLVAFYCCNGYEGFRDDGISKL